MTSSSNSPLAAAAVPARHGEQRREMRVQTVYLPCCLRTGSRCSVGLIRNVSPSGLLVETAIEADPGSEIDYFQDSAQWRRARVVWRDGPRMGLEDIDVPGEEPSPFPHRAIRIPTSMIGRMWLHGRAVEVGIGNISHQAVLAFGLPPIDQGQLVTISIAGSEFANTSLRWWADGSAGLRFERPMTMRALTELIEYAGQRACGLYYERRVGELLEVVPANDRRE